VQICPACGQENPDGFRLCGMCGALLGAGPEQVGEERKIVSVLFTDLVGFTGRAEGLDPEDVRAMLSPYYARLREQIEQRGGTVEKFIGDAVMAVFGAPVAHEDDAERAVRTALAIREAIRQLNERDPGLELQIRTAVNTGEAVVSLGARPSEGEGIASGDVVNTAARLQSAAPIDGILVGEATYRATRHVIDYREAPPVQAKGKAQPITVWEAVAAHARYGIDVDQRPTTTLVGRERELGFLTEAFRRCRTEQTAQLVTLVGVPGVGKSRLVAELFRIIDADPEIYWWRQGRSLPYGETQSFWAFGEIVKAQAAILETDTAEIAEQKLLEMVGELLGAASDRPWVERHVRPLAGVAGETDTTADRRNEAFSAWRRLLEALAEQRPLVLVFEDLHWADDGLLDFVDYLADWVATVPMLIVATARPELLDRRPGWGGGKRNASTVSIPALSAEETARLLGSLLDQTLLPAELQTQVLARAEGNPLYAEQYVRMLQDRGFLVRGAGGWQLEELGELPLPETVQGMIAARLDALPPAQKELVQDAAVVGKVFWPAAIAATGARSPQGLEEPLHALERKEFIRRDRRSAVAGETQYAFLHLLVRDVAYGQIPRSRRVDMHRRAAEWIESLAPDRSEDHAEMLAHHYREALALAAAADIDVELLRAPARAAFATASERAESLQAWPAAREFAEAASGLTDEGDPQLPRLQLRVGRAAFFVGDLATETVVAARDGFLEHGDIAAAAEAEAVYSRTLWYRGEGVSALAATDRAVQLAAGQPLTAAKVWVFAQRARRAFLSGELVTALDLASRTLEMAEELRRDDYASHALNTLGMARVESGDEEGVADLERSIERAERANAPFDFVEACNNLANMLWQLARLEEAAGHLQEARQAAERHGMGVTLLWQRAEEVYERYLLGDYPAMVADAERFLTEHGDEQLYQEATLRAMLSHGLIAAGRSDDALEHSQRGLARGRDTGDPQSLGAVILARGYALAAAGVRAESTQLLDELLASPTLMRSFHWLSPLPLLLLEQGRGSDYVAACEAVPHSSPWRTAGLAAAQGDLVVAADAYERIASKFVEAWARLLAAEAGCPEPDIQLARAQTYFERIGATPYLRRCKALLTASA
jgi:class 3 adenylate cyclase/tetratricopeptide (TPR) repeat protein